MQFLDFFHSLYHYARYGLSGLGIFHTKWQISQMAPYLSLYVRFLKVLGTPQKRFASEGSAPRGQHFSVTREGVPTIILVG